MPKSPVTRRAPKARVRAPEQTREALVAAAFMEIYRNGFQAASIENILAHTGVTKGALYHHFPDKHDLGLAVLRETVRNLTLTNWVTPLDRPGDPITLIQEMLQWRADSITARTVELGCPLNNLAQEMSPLDSRFRRTIEGIYAEWIGGIAAVLERGLAEGSVRQDVDPKAAATFMVAMIEGSYGLAKGSRDGDVTRQNFLMLREFIGGLRSAGSVGQD